jgi:hypothetical protein
MDIVERLEFDAVRCELQFSKGVAGNITEAAAELRKLRTAIRNMLDALDCNDEIAAYAYAKTALGNEQRVAGEGG